MKTYTQITQGDTSKAWICEEFENEELINRTMVYSLPLDWASLRLGLMTSKAFVRILSNPDQVNMVAYGALQTILSTESNEQHLLQILQLTMSFTQEEKNEINSLLENNFFSVRL